MKFELWVSHRLPNLQRITFHFLQRRIQKKFTVKTINYFYKKVQSFINGAFLRKQLTALAVNYTRKKSIIVDVRLASKQISAESKILLNLSQKTAHEILFNSFAIESLSYRNQSMDLQRKSMDWFLYARDIRHGRVKDFKRHI